MATQFGPYRLDPGRRVLTRANAEIHVSARSFDTLLALISRPGETLTKSELLETVWGGAIVEENSLNKCISELRKALGQRRGCNDYILTVSGVGYRFVAPVTPVEAEPPAAKALPRHSRFRTAAIAAAVLIVVAAAVYAIRFRAQESAPRPARRLSGVILRLKNLPDTPQTAWIATAVGEMLYHELLQLSTAPGAMWLISPDEAAQSDLGKYPGADMAIAGAVTILPGPSKPLRIDVRVENLHTGEIAAAKSIDGAEDQMFSLVRTLAEQVGPALGASEAAFNTGPSAVPTSAGAMRLYAEGLAALRSYDVSTARDRLLRAVEDDPYNALCYAALASAWSALGYDSKAADAARRAFELSSSLDQLDRLAIEGRYRLVTRGWQRAGAIYESIGKLVPDSIENASALLEAYQSLSRMKEAQGVIARLRSQPAPGRDDPRIDFLEARLAGASWSDYPRISALAKRAAEKAQALGMRGLYARARLLQAGAMWSAGEPGSEQVRREARTMCEQLHDSGCVAQAWRGDGNASLLAGRVQEAQASYDRALLAARQAGNLGEQFNALNGLGLLQCGRGDLEAARRNYREMMRIEQELGRHFALTDNNYAHVLAESGRLAEARERATAGLVTARASHEIESEADALAALAELDRMGGDPKNSVRLTRQALAVAKRSGKKLVLVEINLDLALSLAATGERDAAVAALRDADALRGGDNRLDFELASAAVAFYGADYRAAEQFARAAAGEAGKTGASYYEVRAESLLARALLAQHRAQEGFAEAQRAVAIRQTPECGMARLQARFAEAAARAELPNLPPPVAGFDALLREALAAGYAELALEIRLASAEHAALRETPEFQRLCLQLFSDSARVDYMSVAARARRLNWKSASTR